MAQGLAMQEAAERISKAPLVADSNQADPSVSAALERLLIASQGVVTKRIDLALLQAHELVSRGLMSIFLLALNVVWIAGAWFAFVICGVTLMLGNGSFIARVAAFGVLNAAAALVSILAIRRWATPETD